MTLSQPKVAVVTGGSRGIGASVCRRLLQEGWRVIAVSKHSAGDQLEGSAEHVVADLATREGLEAATSRITEGTSRIDLLVNGAGAIEADETFGTVSCASLNHSFNLHVVAPFVLTRSFRHLLAKGDRASVINIGSIYGHIADIEAVAYCLSKASVPLLTEMMARSLAPDIRVNCILPGHVDTDMTRAAPADFLAAVRRSTPLDRIGSPEEIADTIMFLASSQSSFITGAVIRIDGGFMTGRS